MLNPYVLLAIIVAWICSCAGSAYVGWDYRDGKVAQQIKEATDDALSEAKTQNERDTIAAVERAKREAAASTRARLTKDAGVADAINSHSVLCERSAVSVRLLNSTIDSANGQTSSTQGMSLKLRATSETE